MSDTRHKNKNWNVGPIVGHPSWDQVRAALLMDIRDELKRLNALLYCGNFQNIPSILRRIRANTTKRRRRKTRGT
jgi:hypothetical protein